MTHEGSRPTLADVAARAGVSASTASLAFSGAGPVTEATRQRVLTAARELDYAGPDPRARSLRRGRSGVIGVVIQDRVLNAFRDPVTIAMLDGLAEELGSIDAGLLILTDAGQDRTTIEDASMDAVVLIGSSTTLAESTGTLRRRGVPIVAIEGGDPGVYDVTLDNREASARGAAHLRQLGHVRVALVTLPLARDRRHGPLGAEVEAVATAAVSIERLAGVREVYPDIGGIVTAGSRVEEGRRAGRTLLEVPAAERPTAIVAQSDLLAAGVIRAAEDLGIAVPGELSVLGFDGARVDGLWPYDLATLVQPSVAKGRAAGAAVLAMLRGEDPVPAAFTATLHPGNTTGPAPR